MSVRRAGVWLLASTLINLVGARVLDTLGLIEALLSPNGWRFLLIVPVAVAFYTARFIAWFVAPGLVLGALVRALLGVQRSLNPPSRAVNVAGRGS